MKYLILTKKEAERILKAKEKKFCLSFDLGKTTIPVEIKGGKVLILNHKVPLSEFKKVREDSCFVLEDNKVKKLGFFSEETNLYYKLLSTKDWPTITLSSTPMHRHTSLSPKEDALLRMKEIGPIKGKVLDTCCGLGYTAILASRTAEVWTFERDGYVLYLAEVNPYSQELFDSKKIKIISADVFEGISQFADDYFDIIIHDPPTFKYSPDLYSLDFYQEMYRVMKPGGVLYHYAPAPHKTKGEVFHLRIIGKLKEAGFSNAEYRPNSSGVVARKD